LTGSTPLREAGEKGHCVACHFWEESRKTAEKEQAAMEKAEMLPT